MEQNKFLHKPVKQVFHLTDKNTKLLEFCKTKIKTHVTIEIETIQIIETEFTRIIHLKSTPHIDNIIKIVMVDPMITPETKTTTTKIDQKTILNHHIKFSSA